MLKPLFDGVHLDCPSSENERSSVQRVNFLDFFSLFLFFSVVRRTFPFCAS